jgi:hypothetical protein
MPTDLSGINRIAGFELAQFLAAVGCTCRPALSDAGVFRGGMTMLVTHQSDCPVKERQIYLDNLDGLDDDDEQEENR